MSSAFLLRHIISPHRPHIKTIFQSIAAKVGSGEPCCDWVNIYLILTLWFDLCSGSLVAESHACFSLTKPETLVVDFLADCVLFKSTITGNLSHSVERQSFMAGLCAGGAKWVCDPCVFS